MLGKWKVWFGLCGLLQVARAGRPGRPCWFPVVCGGDTVIAKRVTVAGVAALPPFWGSREGGGFAFRALGWFLSVVTEMVKWVALFW